MAQLLGYLPVPLLYILHPLLDAALVVGALKGGESMSTALLGQLVHAGRQLTTHARWQGYGSWLQRFREIVKVALVIWNGHCGGDVIEVGGQGGVPARARHAGDEDAIAGGLDAEVGLQRSQRPVLADGPLRRRKLASGRKPQLRLANPGRQPVQRHTEVRLRVGTRLSGMRLRIGDLPTGARCGLSCVA